MALFENLQRRAQKLGINKTLIYKLPYVSLISAIAGIVWLLVLPVEGQFRRTYISENALMPAQAETYFRESEWNIVRGYREEVHMLENASDQERIDAVTSWFKDIGLKVSHHSWQLDQEGEIINGTNVYGILHAPRSDSTEAMVLAAPWINGEHQYNDGGVALVASLARYFKRWSIWSKNIIFVVPSDSHYALRYWVSAYHTTLKNTAGAIEGAVVLDYPGKTDYLNQVEIFYDGLNGQLPNLDLYNSAVESAKREGMPVILNGMHVGYMKYIERLQALLFGILRMFYVGILPGPGSENFAGWRIDAITFKARGEEGPFDITTFGRLAESVLRSINNLLEHFHQSFFFYLLLSPKYFVSIGTYLPAAMAVAQSFPLMAIYIFFSSKNPVQLTHVWTAVSIASLVSGGCIAFGNALLVLSSQAALNAVVIVWLVLTLIVPPILRRISMAPETARMLQIISLIFHGMYLTTLATVNFALSMVIGVMTVPLAWIISDSGLIRRLLLIQTSSPWTGLLLLSYYTQTPWQDLVTGLLWGWKGLDLWTGAIIVGIWLPVWIVQSIVAYTNVREKIPFERKNK